MKYTKDTIRQEVAALKKKYSTEDLLVQSEEIISVLEATDTFCKAKNILIYHSLRDEVQTSSIIEKYADNKTFFLPAIDEDNSMVARKYDTSVQLKKSDLGILEPVNSNLADLRKIDLIIVPGIAFDRELNRMGRGKGYYDKFLEQMKTPKIGLCFDFQLFDKIPTEKHDIPMDMLVLENEIICNGIY
ncbi:MAG: 5-formyltetrahydrofolate cyclo-ligase [Dysgonomonas sp.]